MALGVFCCAREFVGYEIEANKLFFLLFWIDLPWWLSYTSWCSGLTLMAVCGYDAQARMLGMGNPGEDLLHEVLQWIKGKVRKGQSL